MVPAGPYYQMDNNGSCPSHMCDFVRSKFSVRKVIDRYRNATGSELTTVSRNLVIYIVAGILKHKAFLNRYPGLDPIIQFKTILDQGSAAICEAFGSDKITPSQMAWIEAEQSRCVKVVTRYPEVLDEACEANNSMFQSLCAEVEQVEEGTSEGSGEKGRAIIECLVNAVSTLSTKYIDLTVYGRRTSSILNTALPRFRKVEEQEAHKQQTLDFLHNKLEAAYHAVFVANDYLIYAHNQIQYMWKSDDDVTYELYMDAVIDELRGEYVSIRDLVRVGITSEECIRLEHQSRTNRDGLLDHLIERRWANVTTPAVGIRQPLETPTAARR